MGGFAWVTLATNDSYSLGALVLAHSLRRVNTAHQLVVLITPGVTEAMKTQLSAVFNVVKLVDVLDSGDADNLALLARPELGITFTKLHCWKLTEYDKCVFLDADTLVLQNSDELFEREELSAAPDAGWPDCFNSGVFVYKPSSETFRALIEFALIHGSFDGGDQGLLNLFFSDWPTKDIKKHLSFVYNMCSTATYSYLPAFKQFGHGLKIIHFIGAAKPWLQPFNTETGLARVSGESQHITHFVQFWWDIFCTNVHPSLSTDMSRHRLSSCYVFSVPSINISSNYPEMKAPTTLHLEEQNYRQNKSHIYFDPWDQYTERTNTDVPQEVSQTSHSKFVDNHSVSNDNKKIIYSDHHSESLIQLTNYKHTREHWDSVTPHYNQQYNYEHPRDHTSSESHEPESQNRTEIKNSNLLFGGGHVEESWSGRSSRQESFSQPERSLNVPEIKEVEHVGVDWHSHAPTPTQPLLECHGSNSVASHQDQHPLPESDAGLAGALASVTLGAPLTAEQSALEEHLRRQGWEQGNIDYMGKDSFSNIWQKICDTLASGGQQPPKREEVPPPVAPIAAPVYVSSVEISPSGPIDTSPPANYAPVSAPKTTVVASETEVTPKVAPAETSTVVSQSKSPSVTEVSSTESKITPSSALETSSVQLSGPTPVQTGETVTVPQSPVTTTESSTMDVSIQKEPTLETLAPLSITTPPEVSTAVVQTPIEKSVVPPPPEVLTPAVTTSVDVSAPVVPTEEPIPVVPTTPEVLPPVLPIPTEKSASVESPPPEVLTPLVSTPKEVSAPVEQTPTKVPAAIVPTPTDVSPPVIPDVTKVSVPVILTQTETPGPVLPTEVPSPVVQPSTEVVAPLIPTPTQVPAPVVQNPTELPTPVASEVPPPVTLALSEVPTPVAPTPTEVPTPVSSTPTEVAIPLVPTSTDVISPIVPTPTEVTVPEVETPTQLTSTDSSLTAVSLLTSAQSVSQSATSQPVTVTSTTKTPPTSPSVPVEPSLPIKLKVEADLAGTPPVGGSSVQSGATGADEPPVPPKRKGSKASQEAKNQKGKPAKGKK